MRRLLSLFLCVLLCFSIPFGSGVVASATGPTENDSGNNQNPGFVIKFGTTMNGITSTNRGTVSSGVTMQAFPTDLTGINSNDNWIYVGFQYDFDESIPSGNSLTFTHNIPNGIYLSGVLSGVKGGTRWNLHTYDCGFGQAPFCYVYVNGEYYATYDGPYCLQTTGSYGEKITGIVLPDTDFGQEVYSIELRYLIMPSQFYLLSGGVAVGDMLQKIEASEADGYTSLDYGRYSNSKFIAGGGSFVLESSVTTAGLLASIVGWLNSILQALNNIWNTISSGFSNVVSAITSLPQKLWTLIENGLKALFVPTEEQLQEYHDKWSELMSDRFGALYQCMDLVDQFFTDIQDYSTTGVIEMPGVTVDLAGTPWTFGGYDIDVVPDGFDFLADSLKLIVDIVCTLAFINAMKNRFERLLGG